MSFTRTHKWELSIALVVALVISVMVFAVFKPTTLFGVTGTALATSLEREMDRDYGTDPGVLVHECTSQDAGAWSCGVETDPGSGLALVQVLHETTGGCWRSHRNVGSGKKPDGFHNGCIRVLDYLGIHP
jgi:hypothetical protein